MIKKRRRFPLRALSALLLSALTLWTVAALADAADFRDAARTLREKTLPLALLRSTLGSVEDYGALSPASTLALSFSPVLLSARSEVFALWAEDEQPVEIPEEPSTSPLSPAAPDGLFHKDNGVPSRTLRPASTEGYTVQGRTFVSNASDCALSQSDLTGSFVAGPPQVLIVHTHATESYTMPEGEEYIASDEYRTLDEEKNMLRVGEEIAEVLRGRGFSVLHDKTLHDYPNYSGAYNRSATTVQRYLEGYPSLVYVLDVHRDAVEDERGQSYKLLCAEEPTAAQLEFVLGSSGGGLAHEKWKENLRLACAVQENILAKYPTLMRPIIVRNSRYNQQLTPGSLLIEVGTAGNSLDEALAAARIFADCFADTLLE